MTKTMKCEVCGCTAEVRGSDGSTMTCCGQPMVPGAVMVGDVSDGGELGLLEEDGFDGEIVPDVKVNVNVQAVPGAVAVPLAMAACLCGSVIALGFAFSRQAKVLRR